MTQSQVEQQPIRVRFAPSPTGELHVGSARTALYNWLFTRQHGGGMILRVEDTDQSRFVAGSMDRFFEDLKWLGIDWDEGPDLGGLYGPYIQSERLEAYRAVAESLVDSGHAYRCYCSPERLEEMRQAQMAAKQPPKYDRHCLKYGAGSMGNGGGKYVIRLLVPEGRTKFQDVVRGEVEFDNVQIDDQILLKSDGFPTYHLAVVVDDRAMGISHVIRGEEWLSSTPKHIMLYQAFGWEPPVFVHLPLILNGQRQKLSKRRDGDAVWVATYRKLGYLPEAFVNYLALVGWNPGTDREIFSREELIKEFSLERIHKAGGIFDDQKLRSVNHYYLKQLSNEAYFEKLEDGGFLGDFADLDHNVMLKWITILRDRVQILSEFLNLLEPLLHLTDYPTERLIFRKSDQERTKAGLGTAVELLKQADSEVWQSSEALNHTLAQFDTTKLTNGDVFWPVRVGLSGLEASPSPAELLWVLGKDESLQRIEGARNKLTESSPGKQ